MKPIQMVDLKNQYLKIKSEIDHEIAEVLNSSTFVKGAKVTSFEQSLADYLGVKHVISCGNGTDALQIALMALDLQSGDEVITTPFTFIATAEVIALLGLTPVFVDVNNDTFNIDVAQIEARITSKTKVILPVHLFGQCSNMEEISLIAKKHNLWIIEDVCQSTGTDYCFSDGTKKKSGTIGHIGCTSFFPSKNLGAFGDGGAMFTDDDELAHKLRGIANHGMYTRYYHDMIGVNSRLDTIQAAVLHVKLKYLNEYVRVRQKVADYYDQAFHAEPRLKIPTRVSYSTHSFHQYTLQLKEIDREKLIRNLKSVDIPAMVYYPVPLHLQKAFEKYGGCQGDFPVSEYLSDHVLSLPMHTELEEDQLDYIVSSLFKFLK